MSTSTPTSRQSGSVFVGRFSLVHSLRRRCGRFRLQCIQPGPDGRLGAANASEDRAGGRFRCPACGGGRRNGGLSQGYSDPHAGRRRAHCHQFNEGDLVQAGDLVATIDDRPYRAALAAAQAQLARDRAMLAVAERELARAQTLLRQKCYVCPNRRPAIGRG
ncbi:biotin/lipoyl-binding protein [Ensifer sp. IC4062]|nr:biotin/lipoyl-binding protein [Ensifer sp. IC4062]